MQVDVGDLEVLHGLAVVGELERSDDETGGLEPLQVHVQQRPADADLARQVAHVVAAAGEGGEDAQPDGVGQGRQHLDQVVAARPVQCHAAPSRVRSL
ncbi:hypothetical protein U6N30_19805 [Blastococcus brunescens]|uniref:Uncharacterized protein n=1 Tax=Blastococcus brunescens TaxID=1564165 RepID=A0ABZ1AYU4_9ACTN|nr:hypothetical protein [Blastococcus sp. BMG 8361]WRL62269.1 hypothetical protein U6N30_19805 [Blastococcus sp. BMG 8361]